MKRSRCTKDRRLSCATQVAYCTARACAAVQALESRVLMVSTPATPRPDTLGAIFDTGERQTIINRFDNAGAQQNTLQSKLNISAASFDTQLRSYFKSRTNAHWFFDESELTSNASYINTNLGYGDVVSRADSVVNSHLFPDQTNADTYTVDLPTNVNWQSGAASTNPEFLHALNRHGFWSDLAQSAVLTGQAKYSDELLYELADWSSEYTVATTPAAWSATDQSGWLLDSSIRVENWLWAGFMMLGDADWTGAANSLWTYQLIQQGDYLYSQAGTTTDYDSNRTISLAKSLLALAQMFPELDTAPTWETTARNLLYTSWDYQLFKDGSHVEQSPGYTSGVVEDLLEAKWLDELNGTNWSGARNSLLTDAVDSYWQMLSPDGKRPAIGDTYRTTSLTLFLKAELIQGVASWPAAKPRVRDVWLFGDTAVNPYLGNAVYPALGDRGKTYALADSGNYIMRSGSSSTANQLIFDAGPKGGLHGHYDLFNFELWGGGRPLISDPGAFKYDSSNDRAYVVSTKAHNTLNIDGANTGELEGAGNPGIEINKWTVTGSSAHVTATHRGYSYLAGRPVVTRSVWYNLDDTTIVVDWGDGDATHSFQQSFNLQTEGDATNVTGVQGDNSFRTKYPSGSNVKITPLTRPGQTVARNALTFVTNSASGDYKDDAYRFTVTQSGKFVCFVTLISAYDGVTAPNVSASLLNNPVEGGAVQVQLNDNGALSTISFTPPDLEKLDAQATSRGTFNDIQYDASGNLHLIFSDRDDKRLKYAVRDTTGTWSAVETIDLPVSEVNPGEYQYISMALDKNGLPGVAYFDGWNGDLKFARFNSTHWDVEKIDSTGSVGLYPSLAFSRGNGPVITYYNRTKGDLRMAQTATGGWSIATLDSGNDVGRFSSLMLDPNRADVTKWAVAYEDTTNGAAKFAIQGNIGPGEKANGYTYYTMDDVGIFGGYISLAFYDTKSADPARRYLPAVSFYNATNQSMKMAWASDPNFGMTNATIATNKKGLYTQLFFSGTNGNVANIYYFDRISAKTARYTATLNIANDTLTGGVYALLAAGGREIHVSRFGASVAYTTLDEGTGYLKTLII